jgi:hypothetical protein
MRKMKSLTGDHEMEICEHIMTKNFWEYYISNEETSSPQVKFGYVMGDENELGYIYLPEIDPYIMSRTNDLEDIMPASGYTWND